MSTPRITRSRNRTRPEPVDRLNASLISKRSRRENFFFRIRNTDEVTAMIPSPPNWISRRITNCPNKDQ